MRLGRYLIALTLACCGLPAARAVIVYTDITDLVLFSVGEPVTCDIDFNSDGINDVALISTRMEFSAIAAPSSRVAGFVSPPPDIGSMSVPLAAGDLIDSAEIEPWTWNSGNSMLVSFAMLSQPVNIGLWSVGASFLAVSFEIEGQVHYGWVDIHIPFPGNGGIVRGFAYETTPNMAIAAGAIPEPAMSALLTALLVGGIVILHRRRARATLSD